MKILHIVPSYKPAYIYGGPIESVSKLCEGLSAAGHQVEVLTTTANGETELDIEPNQEHIIDGVHVRYFKRITKDPTHISPALWSYLYKNVRNYDVVNIQSWWNVLVIVSAYICHLRGVKVVISPRGMLSKYIFTSGSSKSKQLIHLLIGKSLLAKGWFHATSEAEYEECKELLPSWNGFIQPNIINLPNIDIVKPDNNIFTLIYMSRIHPKKGLEILFEAISKLPQPCILKIAGSGDEEYILSLKALADDLHISDRIIWLGWIERDDKFKLLMNSDLFVLVSLNENFANVVIESLHVGTPVLVTKDVALSRFITSSDLGWVCSLDFLDVLDKITEAMHDEPKRRRINQQSTAVVAQYFSVPILIDAYVTQYKNISKVNK